MEREDTMLGLSGVYGYIYSARPIDTGSDPVGRLPRLIAGRYSISRGNVGIAKFSCGTAIVTSNGKRSGKISDKSTALLVYCKTGGRGVLASKTLQSMGYNNVTNMDGGWVGWEKAGYPVE